MATNESTAAVTVFQPQNVQTIVQMGPVAVNENQISHDRCIAFGQNLIEEIRRVGMTDELDQKAAQYIANSKKTVTKMRDKRTPLTKLFDEVRSVFTNFENEIDPGKAGTVPYQIQQLRNQYAAKKREEAEAKARAEALRQAHENAVKKYALDVEDDFKRQLNALINEKINELNRIDSTTTLDNYAINADALKNFCVELPQEWLDQLKASSYVRRLPEITSDECAAIQARIIKQNLSHWVEQYRFEVESTRDDLFDRLPSKKRELERMAAANAEEAARIKAEMEAREREEAARKERERQEREAAAKAEADLAANKQEMDGLFGAAMLTQAEYQPKTDVKKRIEVYNAEGVMQVVAFWWSQVGCTMSVEELTKMFSKQFTYANKAANDKEKSMFINSEHVQYVDEVKAK